MENSTGRDVARRIVGAIALFAWVGCGGGGEGGASEEESARDAETAEASCVADYAESPCDLLTEEIVRREVGDVPAEIEVNDMPGGFPLCGYSWPSERTETREFAGRTMEFSVANDVRLSSIETYEDDAGERFRRSYLPTAEERERAREMMRESFERRAEEEGLGETEREIGEGIADVAEEATASSRRVEEVGSNASWSGGISTLHVLDGSTKFEITADVSADDAANRETAAALARAVMAACE